MVALNRTTDADAVNISDLIIGVDIALGNLPADTCPAFENTQGKVDIARIIKGVRNALNGCSSARPFRPEKITIGGNLTDA